MKEKKLEKAEMKESLLSGEALALDDAELEGAAGGCSAYFEAEAKLPEMRELARKVIEENANRPDAETDPNNMEQPQMSVSDLVNERFEPWKQRMSEAGIPLRG